MYRKRLRRLALFPLISLVPLALVAGAVATSIEALLRVRRVERQLRAGAAA